MTIEIRRMSTAEAVGCLLLLVLVAVALFLAGQVTTPQQQVIVAPPAPSRIYLETVPKPMAGLDQDAYVIRYLEDGLERELYCESETGREVAEIFAGRKR